VVGAAVLFVVKRRKGAAGPAGSAEHATGSAEHNAGPGTATTGEPAERERHIGLHLVADDSETAPTS